MVIVGSDIEYLLLHITANYVTMTIAAALAYRMFDYSARHTYNLRSY